MLAGTALRHQMILPEQQSLYDYWRSKCRAGKLPSRYDIDPGEIRAQLPMISLVETCTMHKRRRYKYRLAGTGFWELFESEITGKYIDELPIGCRADYWHRVLNRIVDHRRPSAGVTRPGTPLRSHLAQFWIRLPLSEDGENISTVLGFDHLVNMSALEQMQAVEQRVSA
jgi:hypothetical protein